MIQQFQPAIAERERSMISQPAARKSAQPPQPACRVAYIMSRFPKLTETFVLYEILAMQRLGLQIEVFPLRREREPLRHDEAERLVERAHFTPLICSWSLLRAHAYYLRRRPAAYLGALWTLLRANFGSLRYFLAALVFFPKSVLMARQMSAQGIAHLHAHFASHPAAVAFVIHRLTGIPYSFTAHGSDLHCDRHMLSEKVAAAAFVVTVSEYNRRVVLAECGPQHAEKLHVIHCGIDTRVFQPRETSLRRGPQPFNIVCTGTLHEVKGQRYLLEACRLLAEQGFDFQCHLIGDGPDREQLTALARQTTLRDRIHFHGKLVRSEVCKLLSGADVVAAPSVPTSDGRREGIPVALMEALGCGIPAVASRLSGIPELIEDGVTGLLAPPRDAGQLAEALARLGRDARLRRRLGRQGRAKVEQAFDLMVNAGRLADRILHTQQAGLGA